MNDLFSDELERAEVVSFPPPRDFQRRAHDELRRAFESGHRNILLVAPTGAGKTYMALRICHEAINKGRRALFVCDRVALIDQTSSTATSYGMWNHGIIQAGRPGRDYTRPLQIGSIQTIGKRGYWPDADVIVVDEAHTQYHATKEKIKQGNSVVIGLTATPCTRGLGKFYTHMVNAATMHELTQQGVLVPMRILSCTRPDMTGAETVNGEWTAKAASQRGAKILGDVVTEWITHGEDRKTIAFGPDIAYCVQLMQRFNAAGVNARVFTSETSEAERLAILHEFRKPDSRIRVLVSVEALAKGFDVPDIGAVIDCRPLRKSLSTAIQMWGRGLRASPETGKKDCILLDHSGNILRFLQDFTDIFFNGFTSLDTGEKLDRVVRKEPDREPAQCPECGYTPFYRRCMSCGHEKQTRVLEDTAAGVMREIRIGGQVAAKDALDLWQQLCTFARRHVNSSKKAGWAWWKYQAITGKKVPRDFPRFEQTEDVPITPATIRKLKQLRIAYHKARAKAAARAGAAAL